MKKKLFDLFLWDANIRSPAASGFKKRVGKKQK